MMSDCIPTIDAGTYPERVFFFWLGRWDDEYTLQFARHYALERHERLAAYERSLRPNREAKGPYPPVHVFNPRH
jgi:hypothetical protein